MYDKPFVTWHYSLRIKWPGSFMETVNCQLGKELASIYSLWEKKNLHSNEAESFIEEINSQSAHPIFGFDNTVLDTSNTKMQQEQFVKFFVFVNFDLSFFSEKETSVSIMFILVSIKRLLVMTSVSLQDLSSALITKYLCKVSLQLSILVRDLMLIVMNIYGYILLYLICIIAS